MNGSSAENLFFNTIFSVALEKKATDIHLMTGNYPVLRLDSKLFALADEKILTVDAMTVLVDSLLTPDEKQRLSAEKEVRSVYTWANRARFRVAVFYQQGYPAVSLRMIPQTIPEPSALQIPPILLEKANAKQGLIIVCGPFNSGRTMTIASIVQHINSTQSRRIATLERPIEYVFSNAKSIIDQREVGVDTPSYVQGLNDLVDDDVEVVAVGEFMELGVPEMILTLAESGKLVFLIMNVNSSISALEKFLGNIPKEKLHWAKDSITSVLLAISCQRLVPAVAGGRVLVSELLTMSPAVASIVQEDKFNQLTNVLQTSRDEGMVNLDYRLSELVRSGKISLAEAKIYALDPANIH